MDISATLSVIRLMANLSQSQLAQLLGTSLVSIDRWERGASMPGPAHQTRIADLHRILLITPNIDLTAMREIELFSSRGVRRLPTSLPMFKSLQPKIALSEISFGPVLERIIHDQRFFLGTQDSLDQLLKDHRVPAGTVREPLSTLVSAGKNTYTYDAHTYHTKVPPQGIAELLAYYLPHSGLVLDPFAGSGMTGVASRALGYDCILNELSPAACFIASRFVSTVEPEQFEAAIDLLLSELQRLREALYTTTCRECGNLTEVLYTVWSYRVICNYCEHEFLLWDQCRSYGRTVREHKILGEFPCPMCHRVLKKSLLKRTVAEPVQLGYKCCGSRQQEVMHTPDETDLERIAVLAVSAPLAEGFYPQDNLPDGINLHQPKVHGIDRVDRLYTRRNLSAMSHLWETIHRIEDANLAAQLAFVFTSLYQRVTRLSEFRFWGGSGNTARYNVPFIFNETNVFVTFARKARSIQDHLEATASHYQGKAIVVQDSATHLEYISDESIDLIFTDPPFGANINYSDMNFLWESWLGRYTQTKEEAIINRMQGKDISQYRRLMTQSLQECYRVLRPAHWMLLVFMNSSSEVWSALKTAIIDAGFQIQQANVFDKQHGTFKQFVSDNTAGFDLVLHCWKPDGTEHSPDQASGVGLEEAIFTFLRTVDFTQRTNVYLHVDRKEDLDYRSLYSEWTAQAMLHDIEPIDFSRFRSIVANWLLLHYKR